MGIIKKIEENNCIIGIWELQESLDELLQLSDKVETTKCKTEKRKIEFLASRLLLKEISSEAAITYNKYGAPEIKNGKFVSISHSKNLVAIVLSSRKVGLDIEQITEKALKLSSKFIESETHQELTAEKATLIWCCKEAIYKWHQKGGVDFKNDIRLSDFKLSEKGEISAYFKKKPLILNYRKINNHYLVYVCN